MASMCACSSPGLCTQGSRPSNHKSQQYFCSLYFNSRLAKPGNAHITGAFCKREESVVYTGLFRIRVHVQYNTFLMRQF